MTEIEYQELKALISDARKVQRLRKNRAKAFNETTIPRNDSSELVPLLDAYEEAKATEQAFLASLGADRLAEIQKYLASNKRRWMRVRDGVRRILKEDNVILVTFTFTDECLASTSEDTRRQYVRRYLKSQSDVFMANRDFGKKNNREHYHGLVRAVHLDHEDWTHGTINFKRVRKTGEASTVSRLSKYIDKLANHALKETAADRIIWSRPPKDYELVEMSEDDILDWLDDL